MANTSTRTGDSLHTAGLFVFMLAGFMILSKGRDPTRESIEKRQAAESEYIEANGCVIAQMEGQFVAKYRCEKPEPRYINAAELSRAAAGAPAN